MAPRATSAELLATLLDPGTWISWDSPADESGLAESYRDDLARSRERAGTDDSVITGRGRIDGTDVAVVCGEFRFLGGSIGAATADRIVAVVERAREERLPLVGLPASGGTRMQEGTPAFVRMADIARAVHAHSAAGLAYVAWLRHPTTGGVLASWASLAQVTWAEPDALVGFLGPAVYEVLHGAPFPAGVQTSEHLVEVGVIDGVVPLEELRDRIAATLRGLTPSGPAAPPAVPASAAGPSVPVDEAETWERVQRTRSGQRPGARDLLAAIASDVVPLSGTGAGERDAALVLALASVGGIRCVVAAQDRDAPAPIGPGGLRTARRGMALAQQLRLPLLTVVDTPGAELSATAEQGALAGEIARCLADLTSLTVPTAAVLLGQGTGGGALALLPAATRIAAGDAWLSPLPPEGASAIVHKDAAHAAEMAHVQRVSAAAMHADGSIDVVIPEGEGMLEEIGRHVARALAPSS